MFKLSRLKSVWSDESAARTAGMEEPSEARFRAWVLTFLILIGPAVLFFAYYKLKFVGLNTKDAFDFAQIARNLMSGKGLSTSIIRPLAVTGPIAGNVPETIHGPIFPISLAIAFAVLGAKDTTAALVSGFFYILTIPSVYLLGSRVFSRQVGLLAAGAVAINSVLLQYSITGRQYTLCVLLATWLMIALHKVLVATDASAGSSSAPTPKSALVQLGVLTALLYLTEPVFVWLIPVIVGAVVAFGGQRRWVNMGWALVPIAVLVLPWMMRNIQVAGDPVYGLRGNELWMHTQNFYAGDSGYRLAPSEVAGSSGLFKAIAKKIVFSIGDIVETIPTVPGILLLFFFLPALFVRFQSQPANAIRKIVLWGALFLTIGLVLIGFEPFGTMAYYMALVPVFTIYALCYLLHLAEQSKLERSIKITVTALSVFYLAFPLIRNVVAGSEPGKTAGMEAAAAMAKKSAPNDACLTDQPWTVAWYGNRRAVWLPGTPTATRKIREQVKDLRWILLTSDAGRDTTEWHLIYNGMYTWSRNYLISAARGQELEPIYIRTDKAQAEQHPLIPALDGFKTYPPSFKKTDTQMYEADPGTALAELPNSTEKVESTPAG